MSDAARRTATLEDLAELRDRGLAVELVDAGRAVDRDLVSGWCERWDVAPRLAALRALLA